MINIMLWNTQPDQALFFFDLIILTLRRFLDRIDRKHKIIQRKTRQKKKVCYTLLEILPWGHHPVRAHPFTRTIIARGEENQEGAVKGGKKLEKREVGSNNSSASQYLPLSYVAIFGNKSHLADIICCRRSLTGYIFLESIYFIVMSQKTVRKFYLTLAVPSGKIFFDNCLFLTIKSICSENK